MSELFGNLPRPAKPAVDPRLHLCACGAFGMFGEGNHWFCRQHVPASFLPHARGGRG